MLFKFSIFFILTLHALFESGQGGYDRRPQRPFHGYNQGRYRVLPYQKTTPDSVSSTSDRLPNVDSTSGVTSGFGVPPTITDKSMSSSTTTMTTKRPYGASSGYGYGSGYGSVSGLEAVMNLAGGPSTGRSGGGPAGAVGDMLSFLGPPVTTIAPKVKPGNFDKHLDSIIVNLAKVVRKNGLDPVRIGNLQQCTNCSMEGLSLIRRAGPSNLIYANRTVTVDAHIIMPALYISCFPCIDVILMVPLTGMLEVAIWGLQIYGKVSQKIAKGENPSLIEYEVENEGDLDIRFNGQGLLGPVTEFGFKIIRQRQVSDIIREFVYERVPQFIRKRLKGFSFPIGK